MTPKKIATFAIGPIGAAFISFITLPMIAWFFSAEDIGRLTMLQVGLGIVTAIFSLQMHQAYVREYHEVKNKGLLFKETMLPGAILLSLFVLITLFLPISISKIIFEMDSKKISLLFILLMFISFFINFQTHIVRMQERGFVYSLSQLLPKIIFIISIALALLLDFDNSFTVLISIQTLSLITLSIVIFILTKETYIEAIKSKVNWNSIKLMLRFSLPLVAGSLAYWGLTALDRLMIRKYSTLDELGIYSVALSISSAAAIFSGVFSNIWHPMVYKWVKGGVDPKKIISSNAIIMLLVTLVWSSFGLFSWLFTYFLPDNFDPIRYLIVGCVSAPLLYMLSETTVVGIGITRKSIFAMLASLLALLTGIIFNLYLTPELGSKGAAISTMFAFTIFLIVRTESSCYLWYQLPRFKMYSAVLMLILVSSWEIIFEPSLLLNSLIWFILMILLLILQYKTWLSLIIAIKRNGISKVWINEL